MEFKIPEDNANIKLSIVQVPEEELYLEVIKNYPKNLGEPSYIVCTGLDCPVCGPRKEEG